MAITEQYTATVASGRQFLRVHLKQLRAREVVSELILDQGEHSIGSDHRSDHLIENAGIAPLHCTILVEADRVTLKSFDKHTWLNEGPVKQAKLKAGDRLLIGPLKFEVIFSYYLPQQQVTEPVKVEPTAPLVQNTALVQNLAQPVIDIHPLLHALSMAMEQGKIPESARPLTHAPKPLDITTKENAPEIDQLELTSLRQELKDAIQETKEQLTQQRQQLDSLVVSAKVPAEQESARVSKTQELNQQLELRLAEVNSREQALLKQQTEYKLKLTEISEQQQLHQNSWQAQTQNFQGQQQALRLQEDALRQLTQKLNDERQQLAEREQKINQQNISLKEQQELLLNKAQAISSQQLEISRLTEDLQAQKADLELAKAQVESQSAVLPLVSSQNSARLKELQLLENELQAREEEHKLNLLELNRRQQQLDRRTTTLLENEEAFNNREAELFKEMQSAQQKRKDLETLYQQRLDELDQQAKELSVKNLALTQKEQELSSQAELSTSQHQTLLLDQEHFLQEKNNWLQEKSQWQLEQSSQQDELAKQSALLQTQADQQNLASEDLQLVRKDLDQRLQDLTKREVEVAKLEFGVRNQEESLVTLEKDLLQKRSELTGHLAQMKMAEEDQDLVRRDLDQRLQDITRRDVDLAKLEQDLKQQLETLQTSLASFNEQETNHAAKLAELKLAEEDQDLVRRDLDQRLQDITRREVDLAKLEQDLKHQHETLLASQQDLAREQAKHEDELAEFKQAQEDQDLVRHDFDKRLQDITSREFEVIKSEQELITKAENLAAISASSLHNNNTLDSEKAALALKLEELQAKEAELYNRENELAANLVNVQKQADELQNSKAELSNLEAELVAKNDLLATQLQDIEQKQAQLQQQESALQSALTELAENRAAWEVQTKQTTEPDATQFIPCYDSETPRDTVSQQTQLQLQLNNTELSEELNNLRGLLQLRDTEFQEIFEKYDQQKNLFTQLQTTANQTEQALLNEIEKLKLALQIPVEKVPVEEVLEETLLVEKEGLEAIPTLVGIEELPFEETSSQPNVPLLLDQPETLEQLIPAFSTTDEPALPSEMNPPDISMSLDSNHMSQLPQTDSSTAENSQVNWSLFNTVFGANPDLTQPDSELSDTKAGQQVEKSPLSYSILDSLDNLTTSLPTADILEQNIEPAFSVNNLQSPTDSIPLNESPEETKARLFREELKSLFGMNSPIVQEHAPQSQADSQNPESEIAELEPEEPADFTYNWLNKFKENQSENAAVTDDTSINNLPGSGLDEPTTPVSNASSSDDSTNNPSPPETKNQPENTTSESEADDESVASYMERLLARSRGWQSAESTTPVEQKKATPPQAVSAQNLPKSLDSAGEQDNPQSYPLNTEALPPNVPRPTINKDEVRKNMDDFRQVANKNARHAIAKHSRKKMQNKIQIDIMLIAVSTLVSIGLFTSPLWTNQSYFIYGILAAGIGLFAAIELMRTQYQFYSITNVNEPSKE